VLAAALGQARDARTQILQVITDCIAEPRVEMNPHAPRVLTEYIPGDKIGEVIGPKGKIIREITEETGADINIDDVDGRGVVHIYSSDGDKAQMALDRIRAIANPVVPKAGERYYGSVVKTADFGAFISLTPGSDGLLHISKLPKTEGRRLNHADEAVTVGQKLWVEVVEVKDGRKFSLAMVDGPDGGGSSAAAPASVAAPAAAAPTAAAPTVAAPTTGPTAAPAAAVPASPDPSTASTPEPPRDRSDVQRARERTRTDGGEDDGNVRRRRRRR
jgi:polyribonucleotide nucleotidyltransferase